MDSKILGLIQQWQSVWKWELVFEQWARFRKSQQDASDCFRYHNESEGVGPWRKYAKDAEQEAESWRLAALELIGETLRIKDYLRGHAPALLPIVPNIDFTREPPPDLQPLADSMVRLEAELLSAADTKTDTGKKLEKNSRALTPRAAKCGKAFKAAKKKDKRLTLKGFVEEWASGDDSVEGIYKSLIANPAAWKTDI